MLDGRPEKGCPYYYMELSLFAQDIDDFLSDPSTSIKHPN